VIYILVFEIFEYIIFSVFIMVHYSGMSVFVVRESCDYTCTRRMTWW
jgi:hypothetical protein